MRLQSLLPSRAEYGEIARWLAAQAAKNGADVRVGVEVSPDTLDEVLEQERPDHVVVATGARVCEDGFQGWTVTGDAEPSGDVVVLDDLNDVVAPLTSVLLAERGCRVRLVTRWPMVGLETILDVYLDWILPKLYRAGVEMVCDRFVQRIDGSAVTLVNVHHEEDVREVPAEWIVMATGRRSENALVPALGERGVSHEAIGDAVAPRGTYEAVYEGHRAARTL